MSGLLSVGATAQNSTQPNEDKSRIMGVRVSVDLFDQKTYENTILPAYRKFIETSNTDLLAHRLHDAIAQLARIPSDHQITFRDRSGYEGDIAVLEGKTYYSSQGREPTQKGTVTTPADMRFFVQNFVGPSLIEIFCL